MKLVEWLKERGGPVERLMQRCGETMRLMSTCDDSEEQINQNATLDAETEAMAMEYLIETCDTDMLKSFHRSADDIVIVDADAAHICADAAVVTLMDWLINLPLS